jgi:hypothetical protein
MWASVDPLAEIFPGRSPYEYCFSNPINLTDPTGMAPEGGGDGDPPKKGWDFNEVVVTGKMKNKHRNPNSTEIGYYDYAGTPEMWEKQYGMKADDYTAEMEKAHDKYCYEDSQREKNRALLEKLWIFTSFFNQIEDVSQVMPGSAVGNLGRGLGKTFLGGLKGLSGSGGNISLFRAVSKAELDDLASSGFRNANGYETGKLFATSAQDASNFGQLLFKHDNIPFTIINTSLPKRFGFKLFKGEMDLMRGVSVPENLFNNLSKPSILDSAPLGNHPWLKK